MNASHTKGLLDLLEREHIGCIPFSPLAQGLLTDKYLHGGPPAGSRVGKGVGFLQGSHLKAARLDQARRLDKIACGRGQSLAQLALAWLLKDPRVTSVLIGASKPNQLTDSLRCLAAAPFSPKRTGPHRTDFTTTTWRGHLVSSRAKRGVGLVSRLPWIRGSQPCERSHYHSSGANLARNINRTKQGRGKLHPGITESEGR